MYSSLLYRSSPVWLQGALITARGAGRQLLREGGQFRRYLADAARTEALATVEMRRYVQQTLAKVLRAAWRDTPFYRELYGEPKVDLNDDEALLGAFSSLPFLDKPRVRAAGDAMRSRRAGRLLFAGHTSGTTGEPLTLKQDLGAINRENAFIARQLRWAGLRNGDRRAWLRGDMIVPSTQRAAPYWRLSRSEIMLMMSSYHLSADTAASYLRALSEWNPRVIQAYPSSIDFLAAVLRAQNRYYDGAGLSGIVTSSESLHDDQRQLIEERFRCRVFDWYGQFERVAAIGTCEHGTMHVMEDYGFAEFVPVEDGLHEIVGTGFNNLVMPLVRYRTGDRVELADCEVECPCGRHMRVVKRIVGRDDDVVLTPEGRRIGRLDHVFKGVSEILAAQIEQLRLDQIVISVVPGPGYGPAVEKRIVTNARERLGDSISIAVREDSRIERTAAGKYRLVVSHLARSGAARRS